MPGTGAGDGGQGAAWSERWEVEASLQARRRLVRTMPVLFAVTVLAFAFVAAGLGQRVRWAPVAVVLAVDLAMLGVFAAVLWGLSRPSRRSGMAVARRGPAPG